MTALLTDNLPLLAGAPNGIKKLRELILELAVRGKLVPQDVSDEPASELLKRIAKEKARLVAEGKIKKQKQLADISAEGKPFELPVGWEWARLGDISKQVTDGEHLTPPRTADKSKIPLVTAKNVRDGYMDYAATDFVERSVAEKCWERCHPEQGDIMMVSVGATLGRLTVIPTNKEMVIVRSVTLIKPLVASADYLALALKSPGVQRSIWMGVKQSAQPCLYLSQSTQLMLSIPPVAEQNRIVAKVDELMALCDRLEAQQIGAESAHAQLVQALLGSLTQAADAKDFSASWQRLAEHFHTLFTTESSISAFKQTLLQLAVMGKLVPQDPNDKPASELLKRIAEEKARLAAQNHRRQAKEMINSHDAEINMPEGWTLSTIGEVTVCRDGERVPVSRAEREGRAKAYDYYGASGVIDKIDNYLFDKPLLLVGEDGANLINRSTPIAFMARGKYWVNNHAHVLDGLSESLLLYVCLYLNSIDLKPYVTGTAQPKMNQAKMNGIPLLLPPEAEQYRIVTKLNQLMAICDQLKARLTQARQINEQLATALVEQAVADDSRQIPNTSNRKVAITLLAAEITHQLHGQRTFGQRKLQKVIYLAEHTAKLGAIQGSYLRNVAGPHDRQLMDQAEGGMHAQQWYERIERDTVGHAYRPLAKAGQHRQAYESTWSAAERATIEQVIALMRGWDTDRCEMTVTLYAAWNDFILEGHPVTDEAIVAEVMHRWNDAKLRFTRAEWLAVLAEMKKHSLLTPSGFGKRTIGGTLTLPGFE